KGCIIFQKRKRKIYILYLLFFFSFFPGYLCSIINFHVRPGQHTPYGKPSPSSQLSSPPNLLVFFFLFLLIGLVFFIPSMLTHVHYRSDASQKTNVWKIGKPNNMDLQQSQPSACLLPVNFMLYKCYEVVWFDEEEDDVPRIIPQLKTLVTQETIKVPRGTLLSESGTMLMTEILSGMHVPVDEQPSIVGKVLNAVESTLCMLPIVVEVEEVTLRMSRNVINPEDVIERVIRESVETDEVKPIPATKSSIDSLEKVRLDSSEVMENCVVCMKNFEAGVECWFIGRASKEVQSVVCLSMKCSQGPHDFNTRKQSKIIEVWDSATPWKIAQVESLWGEKFAPYSQP
ncbi:RING/U-box superfamily protein, partial [Prunus dulcis]